MAKYISPSKMETITQNILSDYGIDIGEQSSPFSIPIEEIIEFHFDLTILWENIDHLNKDETVMAAIFPTEKMIVMNESQKDLFETVIGTRNFTFAHELGHWVLHATDESQLILDLFSNKKVFYCRSKSKKPPEEFQADMFAGCILMPKPIVVSAISKIKETRNVIWADLYELRDIFNVSITALKIRLEQLNLIYFDGKDIYNSKEEASGQLSFEL
ncbi:ImmA/IrrE family metallo-endopeptidase [Bacillus sp. CECT 9360]|uniref:ImmA/IrrE family metallo-endopeptidase n=1 Tax=Bacillus sp. CECT 9360 TaxID=2845821 RepID=UPI001E399B5E|nr:ImmA/IrrE family metallo-endopeptidase [Bacillus sp. CECT 9360]CAH0345734.1 hypothetical protein BCI9360_02032 [Bacillus sp. CECT 9360]